MSVQADFLAAAAVNSALHANGMEADGAEASSAERTSSSSGEDILQGLQKTGKRAQPLGNANRKKSPVHLEMTTELVYTNSK